MKVIKSWKQTNLFLCCDYYANKGHEINDIHSIFKHMKPFSHSVDIYFPTTVNLKHLKVPDIARNRTSKNLRGQ